MPGLSVVAGRDAVRPDDVAPAFEAVRFDSDYDAEMLYEGEEVLVGWSGYPAYPLSRIETDEWHLFLEGALYDVPATAQGRTLERVARLLAARRNDELGSWLADRDGDFLLVVVHKETEAVWVLSDAFARLPAYRATVDGATVVTRELAFLRRLASERGVSFDGDRLAVAQTLLFGYRLGDRTLFDGVRRLPPGSWFRPDTGDAGRVFRHDLGRTASPSRSIEENASRLARRFVDACRNRTTTEPVVVSLSGGLDSRAVAAGYALAGADVRAVSFDLPDGETADDVRIAATVAESLGLPWDSYPVSQTADAERWLLDTKQGMNSIGSAAVVEFLDRLVADVGREATLATGDGGDKALPRLAPRRTFDDVEALARHVVDAEAVVDATAAAAVAEVPRARLVESVADRLRSYPESSLADRYVHFYVRERGINWLNQGEDRNRYFCWSVSPFYAMPFFADAMRCPPEQKDRTRLYRHFLRALSPGLERIEYADFGAAPDSWTYALKRLAYERLAGYPALADAALGALRDDSPDELTVRRLATELATNDAVGRAVSPSAARELLDAEAVPLAGAKDLLTVLYAMSDSAPSP